MSTETIAPIMTTPPIMVSPVTPTSPVDTTSSSIAEPEPVAPPEPIKQVAPVTGTLVDASTLTDTGTLKSTTVIKGIETKDVSDLKTDTVGESVPVSKAFKISAPKVGIIDRLIPVKDFIVGYPGVELTDGQFLLFCALVIICMVATLSWVIWLIIDNFIFVSWAIVAGVSLFAYSILFNHDPDQRYSAILD
jgi:hypothetical protein